MCRCVLLCGGYGLAWHGQVGPGQSVELPLACRPAGRVHTRCTSTPFFVCWRLEIALCGPTWLFYTAALAALAGLHGRTGLLFGRRPAAAAGDWPAAVPS